MSIVKLTVLLDYLNVLGFAVLCAGFVALVV